MKRKYKYKREHFDSQEGYEKYSAMQSESHKRYYLKHKDEEDPVHREKRLLRQRIYNRWYFGTDMSKSFEEFLQDYGITDLGTMSVEQLRLSLSIINHQ